MLASGELVGILVLVLLLIGGKNVLFCQSTWPPCHVVANQEHSPYLHLNDYVTIGLFTK